MSKSSNVALLVEGVDRNRYGVHHRPEGWVALLVEGVDRNLAEIRHTIVVVASPSSWRAWIEIVQCLPPHPVRQVALLVEGVDRNLKSAKAKKYICRRPPRGGRG